jgi:thiosulfate reductase cytochrome b subunit
MLRALIVFATHFILRGTHQVTAGGQHYHFRAMWAVLENATGFDRFARVYGRAGQQAEQHGSAEPVQGAGQWLE